MYILICTYLYIYTYVIYIHKNYIYLSDGEFYMLTWVNHNVPRINIISGHVCRVFLGFWMGLAFESVGWVKKIAFPMVGWPYPIHHPTKKVEGYLFLLLPTYQLSWDIDSCPGTRSQWFSDLCTQTGTTSLTSPGLQLVDHRWWDLSAPTITQASSSK